VSEDADVRAYECLVTWPPGLLTCRDHSDHPDHPDDVRQ